VSARRQPPYPHAAAATAPARPVEADRAALAERADRAGRTFPAERIALVDLLDRVLAGGVVVAGEVTLSIADVDMVTVSLRALITSVSALAESGIDLGTEFGGLAR
jgi:hypothetical protein